MNIEFKSDKVKVRTGKADNSATIQFEVGEYQLGNIKDLVSVTDQELIVSVEVVDENKTPRR